MVRGTAGYETYSSHFIESSQALSFHTVCRDFIQFLPDQSAHILDAGSDAGQNAMALAEMGHAVVAVEPMLAFLSAARDRYADAPIVWHHGSLPELACLGDSLAQFDFILADGVWHHLDEVERALTMQRFASLLKIGGRCAISLRNGPPGMGSFVLPTDTGQTVEQAEKYGLTCLMQLKDQPSIFSSKPNVSWSRVVVEKTAVKA